MTSSKRARGSTSQEHSSPVHPLPPHECEVCGVRFAKAAKRDVHLLDVHGASFGLSPRALSPSAAGPVAGAVSRAVSRAVAKANFAFADLVGERSAVLCALCPNSVTKFRNPRDLSQHILSKHADDTLLVEHSSVSFTMAPPPAKRRKTLTSDDSSLAPSLPRKLKVESQTLSDSKASAMKPPLSPKDSRSRSTSPSNKLSPTGSVRAAMNNPDPASVRDAAIDRRPEQLDFSACVGFTSNSRKAYYRVKKR